MERHTRLSRAAVVLVAIALIAAIAAAVWFASPDAPYVPNEDSGAALGAAAPAEDGTVAEGYQPSSTSTGISDISTARNNPNGNYHLTQDITITSLHSDDNWHQAFSGTLDGAGHTITINAETKNTGCTDAGGLFIGVNAGATIKNMTIVVNSFHYGTSVNNSDTANGGIIGGYASGDKITVDNVKVILNQDSNTMHHGTSTYNGVDTYMYSTTRDHNSIAFNFGGLFGKVEGGTTTIKNTTVYNSAGGKYGFSAWTWVNTPWMGNGKSWINIGGFVGSVQKNKEGTAGTLTLQNVKYDADDDAKISALAESGTDRYNYARLSPFLGVLDAGKLTVDNLIFNAGGTFTSMFYRDDTTTNEHDEGMYNGRGILIGYDVYKWLQEPEGVSSRTGVYLRDAITGETGLGNGDDHTSLLAGNNSWLDGFMSYPSEIEDASFTDDGKIAFALPNRSGEIAKAVRQINQNGNVTTVSDAQIAEQVTEGGGLTWIEAPVVAHGDDTSVSASLNKVSTGAYNVQNYDAVSSADSAYRGSKVYDGTPVNTPTLDVGGTTVNAWTADNTTADAGTKNFAYNEGALSGYATATYKDGTYLVKDGTIYSPDMIIVNDEAKPFALGKNFVYEIAKAPVEVVVANIPGNFYEGDQMPELKVQSVTPNVPGTIAWNDSSLVYGQNEYGWTWTPEDDNNYQPDTGTVMLEVLQATINEIVVSGDFETRYTAYDAFDPTGMVVTAYYASDSEHERGVVLESGDYTVSVENGVNDRLLVANDTVTVSLKKDSDVRTTISITVSKLAVDVPSAVANLVYNGTQQIGVEASADGYYSLSVNTGINAANYTATAKLTDPDNTEWSTGGTDDVTIPWTIAPMTIAGTVSAPIDLTYDGTEKVAKFKLTSPAALIGDDKVTITYSVEDRTNVTGEAITATAKLPSGNNYKWAADAPSASFTIVPMRVVIGLADISDKTYDGNVVDPKRLFIAPNGVDGGALELTVTVDGGKEILNADTYSVTASLASTETNYTADSVTITFTIETIKVSGSVAFTTSEIYDGTEKVAEFKLTSPAALIGDDKVTITYSVEDRINVTGQAIVASVALPSSGNYQWKDGVEPTASLTIVKATPAVTVKLSDDMPGNLTVAATLDNDWLVRTDNTGVEGALTWVKAGELLQQGKVEYGWKFVPTDSNNYNNETGSLWITASEDTLQSITVDGTYKTEYTAYDDFDPTGLVVIAHYASGTKVEVTSGFTLENDKELTDGQITVTLNGVSTTITVTVNKREIPLPTATEGLIFNGKEQNGIDQKWIEQYAEFVKVDGNSQRDAGDYRATVTLTKDTKYVTWEGGSDADVSIPWTIAPMTLDGTVSAADSLEYDGNEKDAAFTVTVGELCGSDQVTFDYGAGDRINVTDGGFTATAQLPSSGNYKWAKDAPSASFTIVPMRVEIGLADVSGKTYDGNVVDPKSLFIAPNGVDGPLALTVTVDGGKEILNAGSYTVTAVLAQGQSNYTAEQAVAKYNVSKADPTVNPTADVQGTLYTSDDLYKIALNLAADDTPGTVKWDEGQRLIADEQGYNWTFVPTDSVNYNGATGVIKLTAVQAALTGIRVSPSAQAEYTAYDAFDRGDIVVEAVYGDVVRAVGDYALRFSSGAEGRLVAGEITVTVSYGDGGASFEESFVIVVAKLVVEKPVVGDTTFEDNGGQITLEIAPSEFYTVTGNTGFGVGSYLATVSLVDADNTVWADGSVDDISIAWTISEPVTSDEVIADILAMEKVTWQNAEEFLDLEARYNALDESEQTAEATAKLATLKAQYDALRNAAFDDIEAAHEVTAKSLGRALAAAAAGLSAAAIALAIAKRRSI